MMLAVGLGEAGELVRERGMLLGALLGSQRLHGDAQQPFIAGNAGAHQSQE